MHDLHQYSQVRFYEILFLSSELRTRNTKLTYFQNKSNYDIFSQNKILEASKSNCHIHMILNQQYLDLSTFVFHPMIFADKKMIKTQKLVRVRVS
jgi:hypothetical protein